MKFRYKKMFLVIITILFILLTFIELVNYLFIPSNLYGVIYLCIQIFIIFLFIPLTYNYKRHYSKERISKIIILIVIGLFASYLLNIIYFDASKYIDASQDMIDRIYIIKNYLKPIIYILLVGFVVLEIKLSKRKSTN